MARFFQHPQALCESRNVGDGTRIWAFAHVMAGAKVGRNCNIGDHAFVESGAILGDNVTVKNQVLIWEGVTVGAGAFIGPGVVFTNDAYPRSPRLSGVAAVARRYARKDRWLLRTRVGKGASIGAGAVILPGLVIGDFAMVGAGALVTKDAPPHAIIVGHPGAQRGWACSCGRRMIAGENGAFRCRHCGTIRRGTRGKEDGKQPDV